MGHLKDFIEYIEDRMEKLKQIEDRLCKLQEKYETFFQELSETREKEFQQLTSHLLEDRGRLPSWFNKAIDQAEHETKRQFQNKLSLLLGKETGLIDASEERRQLSQNEEDKIHTKNMELDAVEEGLKQRSAHLLKQIVDYNEQIRQLAHGFGFFLNFFKMRKLASERKKIDQEQSDLMAQIDQLRTRWKKAEKEYFQKEQDFQKEWVKRKTDLAAVQAKIEYLTTSKDKIILRSTVERVLFELKPDLPEGADGGQICPRCKVENPQYNSFCRICAQRLKEDQTDFEMSIKEIAEVNEHHRRFSEGMRSCQEIIGLVRGLRSGLGTFLKSVQDMQQSQKKHNLARLNIDVPEPSVSYGKHFDQLQTIVDQDLALHPHEFSKKVKALTDGVFTEERIKRFFETMGEELSQQAKHQW